MKKLNKNNGLLLAGVLAISFSSKAMESRGIRVEAPHVDDGDGQSGRVKEPKTGTTGSWLRNLFRTKPKQAPIVRPASVGPSSVDPASQLRTTTVVDSTGVLDKTTLTEQDRIAIEKAGKGDVLSFFRPSKPKTDAAKKVVEFKAKTMKDFSRAEKQLFNEVLADRSPGEDASAAGYRVRIEMVALAEKVVMQAVTDIFTARANTDLYQGPGIGREVNKAKMSDAQLKGDILTLGGQVDRSSVERAIKKMTKRDALTEEESKVLDVLFKGQKTGKVSNTFKSIVDQASSDGVVAYRKIAQKNAVVDSALLDDVAARDASLLGRLGIGGNNAPEVAKAREINTLLARKIKEAGLSKAQTDLFMNRFNRLLNRSAQSAEISASKGEWTAQATGKIDDLISAIKNVTADLEAAYRAAFEKMGKNTFSEKYITGSAKIITGEFPAIEATSQAVFKTTAEKEAYNSLVALLEKSTKAHVANKKLRAAAPYPKIPMTEQEKVVAGFLQDALGKATVTKPKEEEPVFSRTVVPAAQVIEGLTEDGTNTEDEDDSEA